AHTQECGCRHAAGTHFDDLSPVVTFPWRNRYSERRNGNRRKRRQLCNHRRWSYGIKNRSVAEAEDRTHRSRHVSKGAAIFEGRDIVKGGSHGPMRAYFPVVTTAYSHSESVDVFGDVLHHRLALIVGRGYIVGACCRSEERR